MGNRPRAYARPPPSMVPRNGKRTVADRSPAHRHCSGVSVLERDLDALRPGLSCDPLTRRVERDSHALHVSHGRDAGARANRAARLDTGVGASEVVELLEIVHLARRVL